MNKLLYLDYICCAEQPLNVGVKLHIKQFKMEKDTIISEIQNKIIQTWNVNFIPFEDFERDYEIVKRSFLKVMKPLERQYNLLKKKKTDCTLLVGKNIFVRKSFDSIYIPATRLIIPEIYEGGKRKTSFKVKELEEYTRAYLMQLSDKELKEKYKDDWVSAEKEYDSLVQKRDDQILVPFIVYAKKVLPAFFKNIKSTNGKNEGKTETVEELFQGYLKVFTDLVPLPYRLIDNSPEYLLKGFVDGYRYKRGSYQQLLRNASRYLKNDDWFFITDAVVNIGHIKYSKVNTAYGVRINNTYEIFRKSKPPYVYKDTNDCEEVDSHIVNIFLLTQRGKLIKVSVYDKGLLKRTSYNIAGRQIQQVDVIHNCILKAHPHKHFDPLTIVFDTPEKAISFEKKITSFQEYKRPDNRPGNKR